MLIVQLEANLDISLMFAAIVVVTVLGFAFYGVVSVLEMIAIPWHVSRRGSKCPPFTATAASGRVHR